MFIPAKEIVKSLLGRYGISQEDYCLYDIWEKELGKLAKKIKMVGKKNKSLLVKIDNPSYSQELRFRKKEFIKKINGHFGEEVVNEIKKVKS